MYWHKRGDNPQDKGWVSLCARCGREVSNAAYFAGRKGSSHFNGTCRVQAWVNVKERELERETLKPWNPYQGVFHVDYDACKQHGHKKTYCGRSDKCKRVFPVIETLADLCKWWGLPSIGEASRPRGTKVERALKEKF